MLDDNYRQQPTKLHKSYTKECIKGERVDEGGGETIHLNSQPPLGLAVLDG